VDESLIPLTPEEAGAGDGWRSGFGSGRSGRADSSRAALEARLEKAMAEPDYEREETDKEPPFCGG